MKPFRDPYLRPSQIKKIIYASTCLWALGGTLALAAPGQSWQPRLSEKILMLPPQQIERAVESDYKASPLAAELQDLDGQIAQSVSTTETLMEMRSTISAEESIELRHQIIS